MNSMGSRRLCAIGHDLCSSRQDHLQRLLASGFTLKTIWHLGVIALLWFYLGSFFAVDGHVIHLFPSFIPWFSLATENSWTILYLLFFAVCIDYIHSIPTSVRHINRSSKVSSHLSSWLHALMHAQDFKLEVRKSDHACMYSHADINARYLRSYYEPIQKAEQTCQ